MISIFLSPLSSVTIYNACFHLRFRLINLIIFPCYSASNLFLLVELMLSLSWECRMLALFAGLDVTKSKIYVLLCLNMTKYKLVIALLYMKSDFACSIKNIDLFPILFQRIELNFVVLLCHELRSVLYSMRQRNYAFVAQCGTLLLLFF